MKKLRMRTLILGAVLVLQLVLPMFAAQGAAPEDSSVSVSVEESSSLSEESISVSIAESSSLEESSSLLEEESSSVPDLGESSPLSSSIAILEEDSSLPPDDSSLPEDPADEEEDELPEVDMFVTANALLAAAPQDIRSYFTTSPASILTGMAITYLDAQGQPRASPSPTPLSTPKSTSTFLYPSRPTWPPRCKRTTITTSSCQTPFSSAPLLTMCHCTTTTAPNTALFL